ncbi:MAG TPA: hypothetical protein VFD04_23120 [Actinomycetes bacterium]|nr:hypothetical protein [Actinomycetes bacterium]
MAADAALAGWAAANPDARDALLALAERAVALQPAAEAAIQHGRAPAGAPAGWAEEARRVHGGYATLAGHLRTLGVHGPPGELLGKLLDWHASAVDGALSGRPDPPEGLGPPAGRLVGLRDLLRRTLAVDGRPVSDITPGV